MQQWRSAAEELPRIRARELRQLSDDDASRYAVALSPLRPVPLRASSGLVERQAWFAKWRQRLGPDC